MKKMIKFLKNQKNEWVIYGLLLLAFFLVIAVAVLVQDGTPYESIALDLGFAQVAWYAVFILTGITIAATLAYLEFKRVGWNPDELLDALLIAVPLSIVGSRLYYVAFDPDPNYSSFLDVINLTNGGLSIHGAVITAFLFIIVWTKVKKKSFWILADILAVGFLVGQIIGRWGNFMNAEAYGPIVQNSFIFEILPAFIKDQMYIAGEFRHPTFLYEGFWNFAGLIFLLIARRKRWFKVGDMMGLYLFWYGLGRGAIIEPLRTQGHPTDALRVFGLPANILFSLTLFMLGGIAIIVVKHFVIKDQKYYVDMLVTEA